MNYIYELMMGTRGMFLVANILTKCLDDSMTADLSKLYPKELASEAPEPDVLPESITGQMTIKNDLGFGALITWSSKLDFGILYKPTEYEIHRVSPDFDEPQFIGRFSAIFGLLETVMVLLTILNTLPELELGVPTHDAEVLQEELIRRMDTNFVNADTAGEVISRIQYEISTCRFAPANSMSRCYGLAGYYGNVQLVIANDVDLTLLMVYTGVNDKSEKVQAVASIVVTTGAITIGDAWVGWGDDVMSLRDIRELKLG